MFLRYCNDFDERSFSYNYTSSIPDYFPLTVQIGGCFSAKKSYFTEREGLENYLLLTTFGGCGYLKYRNKEYLLTPGKTVVFSCNEYQFYQTYGDEQWEFKWIHFNGSSAANYVKMLNDDGLTVVESHETNKIVDTILEYIKEPSFIQDARICAEMITLLTGLVNHYYRADKNSELCRYHNELSLAKDRIKDGYKEKLTLYDLMLDIPLSKFYFIRLFKQYTGLNPYEYLTRYRINEAKRLLKTTTLSISDISVQTGFNDINNFIRAFKKLTGITPLYFRKYWTV